MPRSRGPWNWLNLAFESGMSEDLYRVSHAFLGIIAADWPWRQWRRAPVLPGSAAQVWQPPRRSARWRCPRCGNIITIGSLIGAEFRRRGAVVVLGGIHVSMLPDEALAYADAVVVGEGEEIWPGLLADFSTGKLQRRYTAADPLPRPDRCLSAGGLSMAFPAAGAEDLSAHPVAVQHRDLLFLELRQL